MYFHIKSLIFCCKKYRILITLRALSPHFTCRLTFHFGCSKVQSSYMCLECKKNYKTQHGLRNHYKSQHPHLTDIHIQYISGASSQSSSLSSVPDSLSDHHGDSSNASKRKISKSQSCDSLPVVTSEDFDNQNVNLNSLSTSMVTKETERKKPAILPVSNTFSVDMFEL